MAAPQEQNTFDWNQYGSGNEPMPTPESALPPPGAVAPAGPGSLRSPEESGMPAPSVSPAQSPLQLAPFAKGELAPRTEGPLPVTNGAPMFASTPLAPRAGIQADAQVFSDLADYYRKSSDAVAQGKHDEALAHHDFANQQEQALGQSNQLWQQAMKDQADREAKMTEAINKGRALSVDPKNYWNKAGTASNILSAIAVGLGSFASGMTHGATGNPGLQLVNNAIEHDIASQKENIDNYWKGIQQQKGLDDNAFNRAMVSQNMESNMRLAGFKIYETELRNVQAKTDSQVVKLGAQKQIDDLQLSMNNERKQLAATEAAQRLAAAGVQQELTKKDSESFSKDMLELAKDHPQASADDLARLVAKINPARAERLGSKSILPGAAQDDHIYNKEKDSSSKFNNSLKIISNEQINHTVQQYEKMGVPLTKEGRADLENQIKQQTVRDLIKLHPEYGQFQFFKPSTEGLFDVRPKEEVKVPGAMTGLGLTKEQIKEGKEQEAKNKEQTVTFNGQTTLAPTKEEAVKFRTASVSVEQIKDDLKQLRELKAGGLAGATTKQKVKGLLFDIGTNIGRLNDAGTIGDEERKNLESQIANPTIWFGSSGWADAAEVDKNLIQSLDNRQKNSFIALGGKSAAPPTAVAGPVAAAPQANPVAVSPPEESPMPAASTSPATWVDNRPDSPTFNKKLNIVQGDFGSFLEDPATGHRYPAAGVDEIMATQAAAKKYGFRPAGK